MIRALACDYRFEFKPADCWIGVFWRTTKGEYADKLDMWICLLPMLPFHYELYYRKIAS